MSERSIETVRRVFDAMRRLDFDEVISYCDPEVEYLSLIVAVEGQESYRGHDGVRRFFEDMLGVWEVWEPRPDRFEAGGDWVLATGTSDLRARESGLAMTLAWGQVFQFRDEAQAKFEAVSAG